MRNYKQLWPYLLLPCLLLGIYWGAHILRTPEQSTKAMQVENSTISLMLSSQRWASLQEGGTWAKLFPPDGLQNRSQLFAVVLWWITCTFLGWMAYPLLRIAMPGLKDGGYPLARTAGLLFLSYLVWLAGSCNIPVTRTLIAIVICFILSLSMLAAFKDRTALITDIRKNRNYFLRIEILALFAFLVFLSIRIGNPDLWHLIFGGEKPMDFSYFNAVLKSDTYPPYDPWFSGGQLNYYYYGFVIVGIPVKLLGITPSVAYNLILPTLFSMVILGAFCVGWNLVPNHRNLAGSLSAIFLSVLGNLGAPRMVWQGWQKLIAPDQVTNTLPFLQKMHNTWLGAMQWLSGTPLPYATGDWYWTPSRAVIPAYSGEITEFPLFTFLYADLHAHLIALPITLLVIAWAISIALSSEQHLDPFRFLWQLSFGALAVGTLQAANSWDYPTYLILACIALAYTLIRRIRKTRQELNPYQLTGPLVTIAYFIGLSMLFFLPFTATFQQSYSTVLPWNGEHVNLSSYLIHWGLFLFALFAWQADEIIDWMAHTPASALKSIKPYRNMVVVLFLLIFGVFLWLVYKNIFTGFLIIPLGCACILLLCRHGQTTEKRFLLFLAGTGLFITLTVELITISGDRMNTTFKYFFQSWTFLSLSAAGGLAYLTGKISGWYPNVRRIFIIIGCTLIAGCAFTTVTSVRSKVVDRMTAQAPHTLDGMAYMDYTFMFDAPPDADGAEMDLSQDARAIHWMQNNVSGSPVIVEAHTQEYRHWGNRFTIYTGLPGIVGWENHERQRRSTVPDNSITERMQQIKDFYLTTDYDDTIHFLQQYQVSYIIVGQLERIYYAGAGLDKFSTFSGDLWDMVYTDRDTQIYEVRTIQ